MPFSRLKEAIRIEFPDTSAGTLDPDLVSAIEDSLETYVLKAKVYSTLLFCLFNIFFVILGLILFDQLASGIVPIRLLELLLVVTVLGIPATLCYYSIRIFVTGIRLAKRQTTLKTNEVEDDVNYYTYKDRSFNDIFKVRKQSAKSFTIIPLSAISISLWLFVMTWFESWIRNIDDIGHFDFFLPEGIFSNLLTLALDLLTGSRAGTTISEMGSTELLEIATIVPILLSIYIIMKHMTILMEIYFKESGSTERKGILEIYKYILLLRQILILLSYGRLQNVTIRSILATAAAAILTYASLRFAHFFLFI